MRSSEPSPPPQLSAEPRQLESGILSASGTCRKPGLLAGIVLLAAACGPARDPGRSAAPPTPTPTEAAEARPARATPTTRVVPRRTSATSMRHDTNDPVAELARALEAGAEPLTWDSAHGYLPALLDRLGIPVSSQMLVFSRTSLQTDRIAPWTPRALYFNDDVYVGWVQESPILEIGAVDPVEGGVFYTVDQTNPETARFRRETTTCLMCHESRTVTGGVPGFMVLSVLTDRHGYVITEVESGPASDRTPLAERWGGWYVTGLEGSRPHAGNAMAPLLGHEVGDEERYLSQFAFDAPEHAAPLDERFDISPYLGSGSDGVAIAVLTHQGRVHNLITAAQAETRRALEDQQATLRTRGGELPEDGFLPLTRLRVESATERMLEGMLFVGEAPWEARLTEPSSFVAEFEAKGPRDSEGRSLRDLDLETRLFRYPLSFLIYSDAFSALPEVVLDHAYARLDQILDGDDPEGRFDHLTPETRTAIREILLATHTGFAEATRR